VLVPLLEALHVSLDTIQSWFTGGLTDAQFTAELPADLDQAPYGGDVLAWLTTHRALLMGMVVLTPTADADPDLDDCDFGVLELRLSLPDDASNALTESEYTKLYRFIRLWRRLGGSVSNTDDLLSLFLPTLAPQPTLAELDAAFVIALARIANYRRLLTEMNVSTTRQADWLMLHDATIATDTRRDQLGRLLRLGAVDFASLETLTGIDPLAADMETDDPSLLRFVSAWKALKSSPLKIADVDFLARHQDPGGGHIVTPVALHGELRLLRDAQAAVDVTFGGAASTDLTATQAAMALVYDPKVVGAFFGLLGGSTTYDVDFTTVERRYRDHSRRRTRFGDRRLKKRLTYPGIVARPWSPRRHGRRRADAGRCGRDHDGRRPRHLRRRVQDSRRRVARRCARRPRCLRSRVSRTGRGARHGRRHRRSGGPGGRGTRRCAPRAEGPAEGGRPAQRAHVGAARRRDDRDGPYLRRHRVARGR
jgi:hypothetical protein